MKITKKLGSFLLLLWVTSMNLMWAQSYDKLWKQVEQAGKKGLPQTVIQLTDQIYEKGLQEHNAGQMLKAYVCRETYQERLTPDSLYTRLPQLEQWARSEKDAVNRAILYSLLAGDYADFVQRNRSALSNRTEVEGEMSGEDIRLWTARQLVDRIDACCTEALRDSAALLAVSAEQYVPFVELEEGSRFYGHDLYHLLAGRAVDTYRTVETWADSLAKERIDGIYKNQIEAYKNRPGREDALVLSTLDYWQNDRERFLYNAPEGKTGEAYLDALDDLIARYGSRPVCADVYLAKAHWLYTGHPRRVAQALQVCEEGIRRYASYKRTNALRNLREDILQPYLSVSSGQIAYPGDSLDLRVDYRNLKGFTLHLYKTDLTSFDLPIEGFNQKFLQKHARRVASHHYDLQVLPLEGVPAEDWQYSQNDTAFRLPVPDELSLYVVQVVPDDKRTEGRDRTYIVSSRLMVLTLSLPDNRMEVLALDRKTGHPVPGVTVAFYAASYNLSQDQKVTEVITDADGRAVLTWNKKILSYVARKDADVFLAPQRVYNNSYGRSVEESSECLSLLTDRSLYRPGQTIYVKGIAYEKGKESARVLEGRTYTVSLLDVNGKEVSKQEVRTNDFGSFSTEFMLPTSCLNGNFQLRVGNLATSTVRVEEYKRPTFTITFDPVKEAYACGDTVKLTGKVEAYNGAALQTLPLAYTVTRHSGIWRGEDKALAADTVQLDEEGRFSIPVFLEKASWMQTANHAYFRVQATVTGENGETQTEDRILNAWRWAYSFYSDLEGQVCKEDTLAATFRVENADGQLLEMEGTYRLYPVVDIKTGRTADAPMLQGTFTSGKRVVMDSSRLPSGYYQVVLSVKATDGKEVDNREMNAERFLLFSKRDRHLPVFMNDFIYEEQTAFDEEQPAVLYYGTSHNDAYVLVDIYNEQGRIEQSVLQLNDTLTSLTYPYKEVYGKGVDITFSFVKNGQLYTRRVSLTKREPERKLSMKWEVFRDRLRPGQQEEWRLVVKNPQGLPAAAEVLATMYDASLDHIYSRHQGLAVYFNRYIPYYNWQAASSGRTAVTPYFPVKSAQVTGWLFDHFYVCYPRLYGGDNVIVSIADVKGVSNHSGVSRGYNAKRVMTGAVAPQADMVQEEMVEVTQLSEMEVTEEAGTALDAGTLQPLENLRTNFAETAFFYPQLRTNEQGELVFSFTAPESLTRWNFRGYSHTRDMLTGVLEGTATTSKEFMLMPNLPRFVRVGDKTHIAASITNLTAEKVKGTATLTLFDPLTDKVITTLKDRFTVEAGRTEAVDFAFEVSDRYDLLGVRIVADGGEFSDGEQHVLPVLSNKTHVTETLALPVRGEETRTFSLDSLFNRHSRTATDRKLTVEFTGNPAWLAIQALPALNEPVSEDAISRATVWFANSLAAYIAASQPRIRSVFEAWKAQGGTKETLLSRLEQNPDLKNMLLSETPWLTEAQDESEQMARLATLFDLNTLSLRLSSSLNRLQELQDGDGAWSWYPGMPGNRYVTGYVLNLLVRLPLLTGEALTDEAALMRSKAFDFLHREIRRDYQRWLQQKPQVEIEHLSDFVLDYLYCLALSGEEIPAANREAYRYYLSKVPNELATGSVMRKSEALVILQKLGKKLQAEEFAASLREHLIQEDELGAHFAFLDSPYRWGMMPIPTHVAAMEALRLQGGNDALLEEMKLWLLQQKKTTSWDTPVSAVNAIYALLCTGSNWLENRGDVRIEIGKETLETQADASSVAGLSYVRRTYTEGSSAVKAKTVTVEKRDAGFAWGAVYAQYLSPMADLKQHGGELSVDKQLYLERVSADGSKSLVPLTGDVRLSVGDVVVSRITIRLDRAMDFVHLKDSRAACFEPVNALSGYRWGNIGYYEDVNDASTDFFFDSIGKGVYVLEHRDRVARSGSYETGIATMQCAYAPEYASHSAGGTVLIEEP